MSPGDKSSDESNHSPTTNRASNRDVITTTFVTSDLDCSCSEFENEGTLITYNSMTHNCMTHNDDA